MLRDQAHKRLVEAIKNENAYHLNLRALLLLLWPQTPKGKVLVLVVTTSARMDEFTPLL